MKSQNNPKLRFKKIRKRKLIAYQEGDKNQLFRIELQELVNDWNELRFILNKLADISVADQVRAPVYKQFTEITVDFGRIRIGDFRIFVHRINSQQWLMLHIYRKTTKKTPSQATTKALNRLYKYLKFQSENEKK